MLKGSFKLYFIAYQSELSFKLCLHIANERKKREEFDVYEKAPGASEVQASLDFEMQNSLSK